MVDRNKASDRKGPKTVYLPEYLWMRLVSLANKMGVSVSKLVVRFCIHGLRQKIPSEELEKLKRQHQISENMEKLRTWTKWGNILRKSGAYAYKAYQELMQGVSPDYKKRIPLPDIVSPDELEATRRLFQHRYQLALETAKLIMEEFPDLETFNIGLDDKGKYKTYAKTITPDTVATAIMNSFDPSSETPFTDWITQQKQTTFYDFEQFKDMSKFFDKISRRDKKRESK